MNKIGIILGIIVLVLAITIYLITSFVANQKANDKGTTSTSSTVVSSISQTSSTSQSVSSSTISQSTPILQSSTTSQSSSTVQSTSSSTQSQSTSVVSSSTSSSVESSQESKVEDKPIENVLVEINESTLPEGITKEEVGIVAKKALNLIDRELFYTVTILLTDNTTVNYFVSKTGYDSLSCGNHVKVNYTIFTNKLSENFSIVNNVSLIS